MPTGRGPGRGGVRPASDPDAWLTAVADAAAGDAQAPAELLGRFLPLLAEAATSGRRPLDAELTEIATMGRRAADQGVAAGRAVDLYLSAAWRLWRALPAVRRSRDSEVVRAAAEAVLRVVDDAVAVLVEGYQDARRQVIRREESLRRELIDDLLRGDADIARLLQRAEPFGLDLGRPHTVTLAASDGRGPDTDAAASALERIILDRFGDRDVLVATKERLLVVLAPAVTTPSAPANAGGAASELAALVYARLTELPGGGVWRVAQGRPYAGPYGVARSYEEAREALTLAHQLRLDSPVVHSRDLLVYRVLGRDQAAIIDLVASTLGPLARARGGAEPLLATLETYFATGGIATETARRMHLSTRAVTYRLARVQELTGHDPADSAQRLALHVAVLGARLLDWPERNLPEGG